MDKHTNKFPIIGNLNILFIYLYQTSVLNSFANKSITYTVDNKEIIQEFLTETRDRISNGVDITFSAKASSELEYLMLEYNITADDIEYAILNLSTENYYTGIDPSGKGDFDVCAFRTLIGKDNIEIYLKYGLETNDLQILIFSNHIPDYPMDQPFKN